MADPEQVQDVPDRRETIEAAFEAAETPEPAAVAAAEPVVQEVAAEKEPTGAPVESASAEAVETPAPIETKPEDRAPQAWKAPLKAKWGALDPEVRQEISRRERETTQVLNDSAQARQLTQQLMQTVQPYQARLKQLGAHPIEAMGRLLKADAFLSSAPPADRAKYMATLIKGYGVDIAALDAALAGAPASSDPVDSRVEQLLQQRLAPFQSFIQQQQQREQQERQAQEQSAAQTVEQMAQDTVKYPYFEQVRSLMADLVEFLASKGQPLTIDAAYNRAIAMDPTISQEVASATASQTLAAQAAASTAKAKRALNASASVAGSPGGTSRVPNASDRRATIEAAFGAAEGR